MKKRIKKIICVVLVVSLAALCGISASAQTIRYSLFGATNSTANNYLRSYYFNSDYYRFNNEYIFLRDGQYSNKLLVKTDNNKYICFYYNNTPNTNYNITLSVVDDFTIISNGYSVVTNMKDVNALYTIDTNIDNYNFNFIVPVLLIVCLILLVFFIFRRKNISISNSSMRL